MKYDVAIIGAGLGGLQCGYILAKAGKRVIVCEQDALLGGCLQTFRRKGVRLDTGFHYVGGMDEGQMLNRLMTYFGLSELPWVKLDEECADEVVIEGRKYRIPQGYDRYERALTGYFPEEADGIRKWVEFIKQVGDNIANSLQPKEADAVYAQSLFARSAYDFLKSLTRNEELIAVISGTALKLELNAAKLPLYTFAQICSSFVQSAYRIRGGGMQIAEKLAEQIRSMGGEVMRNSKVTRFVAEEGSAQPRAAAIEVNGKEVVEADCFIADLHPQTAVALLQESGLVRKIYAKRIQGMQNTFGMFTLQLILKPGVIKYRNNNIYIYNSRDVWGIHERVGKAVEGVLVSFVPPEDGGEYVRNIDILTPMTWGEVEPYAGTEIGNRGAEYERLKEKYAQACIAIAERQIEGLGDAVEEQYCSTPLTYSDYTATAQGSAYGLQKDYNNLMYTLLTPKTPVENVFLTGQNLNLHGILGTSMTSLFTSMEIIGTDFVKDITEKQ